MRFRGWQGKDRTETDAAEDNALGMPGALSPGFGAVAIRGVYTKPSSWPHANQQQCRSTFTGSSHLLEAGGRPRHCFLSAQSLSRGPFPERRPCSRCELHLCTEGFIQQPCVHRSHIYSLYALHFISRIKATQKVCVCFNFQLCCSMEALQDTSQLSSQQPSFRTSSFPSLLLSLQNGIVCFPAHQGVNNRGCTGKR